MLSGETFSRGILYVGLLYCLALLPGYFIESYLLRGILFVAGFAVTVFVIVLRENLRRLSGASSTHNHYSDLLPEELRRDWKLVARDFVWQALIVGAMIGSWICVSLYGILTNNDELYYFSLPIALLVIYLQRALLPWPEKRLEGALKMYLSQRRARPSSGILEDRTNRDSSPH
jgi:hypothetical protein